MVNLDQVRAALARVQDPVLERDVVSGGLLQSLDSQDGRVQLDLLAVHPRREKNEELRRRAEEAVRGVEGVDAVEVRLTTAAPANQPPAGKGAIPGVRNIIPIASGKGGVGKSTVSANLAVALRQTGARVGLLDADVYGPSIPQIMGTRGAPQRGGRGLLPVVAHDIPLMSTAFFLQPDQAVVWRGPMLSKMVEQLAGQVEWGELDYLLVDLPPGTGDVQLTLCQRIPLTGAVIVTTPQPVAVGVAEKAVIMFQQLQTPILGVIENMSYFESRSTGEREDIFGSGGARLLSQKWNVPLLAQIPLATTVRETSDIGRPIVLEDPEAPASQVFFAAAARLAAAVSAHNQAAAAPVEINF